MLRLQEQKHIAHYIELRQGGAEIWLQCVANSQRSPMRPKVAAPFVAQSALKPMGLSVAFQVVRFW
jgi:hypothetical protein